MSDETEGRPEVTKTADLYGRHKADPSKWTEAQAVTGRPADEAPANSTLASRAKARGVKQMAPVDVEDKAIQAPAEAKKPAAKPAKRTRKG